MTLGFVDQHERAFVYELNQARDREKDYCMAGAEQSEASFGCGAPIAPLFIEKFANLRLGEEIVRNAAVDDELIKSRLGVTREEIIAKTFNPDWLKIQEQREALVKQLEAEISKP